MKRRLVLINPEVRARAIDAVREAPEGWEVVVKPATRSLDQNDRFHAMCSAIAKSGLVWAGKPRTAQQWKVLLVSGHAKATGGDVEIIPGLEGEFLNVRESTALMSKSRTSSLMEYVAAFMAAHEIEDEASPSFGTC